MLKKTVANTLTNTASYHAPPKSPRKAAATPAWATLLTSRASPWTRNCQLTARVWDQASALRSNMRMASIAGTGRTAARWLCWHVRKRMRFGRLLKRRSAFIVWRLVRQRCAALKCRRRCQSTLSCEQGHRSVERVFEELEGFCLGQTRDDIDSK